MFHDSLASVPVAKAPRIFDMWISMNGFIILCLGTLAVCDAGLIPNRLVYPQFPHLNAVHHGHGATSYQNVQVENYGSVPIPKELQVDDGHEHLHSHYYNDIPDYRDVQQEHRYYEKPSITVEHIVVSTEAPYEHEEHAEYVESEHQLHYAPSNYEHHDHEAEYEYH